MKYLRVLNGNEKKKIERNLKQNFGIEKIDGQIFQRGEERLFLFNGKITKNELEELEQICFIERMGIYFAKIINGEIRLSIEGSQILKDSITKNTYELNDEQAEQWMKGQELPISTGKKGFLVMKHRDDYLGCGKASAEKIGNFIPKNRRLREKE